MWGKKKRKNKKGAPMLAGARVRPLSVSALRDQQFCLAEKSFPFDQECVIVLDCRLMAQ